MTDPITTPAQMREAAAQLVENVIYRFHAGFYCHEIAAAIRALPVAEPAPLAVRVKPLVWEEVGTALWARDIYGDFYEIETNDGAVVLDHPRLYGDYAIASIDAAQAAAEADHAARILSQIEAVPAAQVRAEALRAALERCPPTSDPTLSAEYHVERIEAWWRLEVRPVLAKSKEQPND